MSPTLRMCPPNLRTETLRSFERRLGRAVTEAADCAVIAQQLGIYGVGAGLREAQEKIDDARVAILGAAR